MDDEFVIDHTIKKTVKLTHNKGQFVLRIPKEIEDYLEIKPGEKIELIIDPEHDKNKYHKFKLIKEK